MQMTWFRPLGLMMMGLWLTGCLTSGPKVMDTVAPASMKDKHVIVLHLPERPSTVAKDLWERSMADFGLESTMIEALLDETGAQVLTGRTVNAALTAEQKTRVRRIQEFCDAVRESPATARRPGEVIQANLPKLAPLVEADYVLLGWISKFSVIGTTKTYLGPAASQSRDCQIIAQVALYDVKNQRVLRNQGELAYAVKSMGLLVTPSSVITDFDLSAASAASQDATTKALKNLFQAGAMQ